MKLSGPQVVDVLTWDSASPLDRLTYDPQKVKSCGVHCAGGTYLLEIVLFNDDDFHMMYGMAHLLNQVAAAVPVPVERKVIIAIPARYLRKALAIWVDLKITTPLLNVLEVLEQTA